MSPAGPGSHQVDCVARHDEVTWNDQHDATRESIDERKVAWVSERLRYLKLNPGGGSVKLGICFWRFTAEVLDTQVEDLKSSRSLSNKHWAVSLRPLCRHSQWGRGSPKAPAGMCSLASSNCCAATASVTLLAVSNKHFFLFGKGSEGLPKRFAKQASRLGTSFSIFKRSSRKGRMWNRNLQKIWGLLNNLGNCLGWTDLDSTRRQHTMSLKLWGELWRAFLSALSWGSFVGQTSLSPALCFQSLTLSATSPFGLWARNCPF